MYRVRCLRCNFTAEVPTLGNVFQLEEEHKADAGDRHLLNWEEEANSTSSGAAEVERSRED